MLVQQIKVAAVDARAPYGNCDICRVFRQLPSLFDFSSLIAGQWPQHLVLFIVGVVNQGGMTTTPEIFDIQP